MKAFVHQGPAGFAGAFLKEMESRHPLSGEVKVRLKTAGLNHRDLFVLHRRSPEDPAVILGSDGAGIVDAVGEGVNEVKPGDEVLVNPSLGWATKSDAPPDEFEILGWPTHGTFTETIIVPAENVEPKPKYLSWEEAGVLPLAALTAYRALFTRGKLQTGQTVLLPGIGSGVATFILQMAKAAGADVYVTSRSEEKRKRALELGADLVIPTDSDWNQMLPRKVDLVIESVGAATWEQSMAQLRAGGTIVTFGATTGDSVQLNLRSFFYGQYNLLGTTMGSGEEFREMLRFVEQQHIHPVIDKVFPLDEALLAMKRLDAAEQFGKIGLRID